MMLATVVTARVPRMNARLSQIGISGTASMCSPSLMKGSSLTCSASMISFTPMKPRITDRPMLR